MIVQSVHLHHRDVSVPQIRSSCLGIQILYSLDHTGDTLTCLCLDYVLNKLFNISLKNLFLFRTIHVSYRKIEIGRHSIFKMKKIEHILGVILEINAIGLVGSQILVRVCMNDHYSVMVKSKSSSIRQPVLKTWVCQLFHCDFGKLQSFSELQFHHLEMEMITL